MKRILGKHVRLRLEQHERPGHTPFVNHVTVTAPIEGRFTIPPGYGVVRSQPG